MMVGFLIGSSLVQAQKKSSSPVILTVEDEAITKAEFEAVYYKNNNVSQNIEQKSPQEYMELFVNYKLKVKEAEAIGLDTIPKYQKELKGYVDQLAAPYLVDREYAESLVKEAYDRMKEDVHASHILITVQEGASPEDTLKAYKKAIQMRDLARAGKDFAELAKENSNDPSAKDNGGDLGYFSALRMVYPFESAAYNTPVGEVSNPVRTSYGYHIIKVHGKRPAVGQMRAAHIMVAVKPDADSAKKAQAHQKINEIYARVQAGEDFGQLARMYSDDRGSKGRAGELPWFGSGRMVAPFENAAFALENDGDVSEPIETQYGLHIIKRLEKESIGTYEEEYDNLKKRVERDRRGQGSREALAKKLEAEYKVKVASKNLEAVVAALDSSFFQGGFTFTKEQKNSLSKPLLSWKDKNYKGAKTVITQADFAAYLESLSKRQKPMSLDILVSDAFKTFKTDKMLEYEREILPLKYPAYKALVQEYRDGILLFELMDRKVWQAAVKDTAGLEAYYEEHKNNFMWPKRLDATIYTCDSKENLEAVSKMLKEGASDSAVLATTNVNSALGVDVREGKFTAEEMPVLNKITWSKGVHSISENGFYLIRVNEVLEEQPKALDEARGLVTSGYQNYLEETWLQELRTKYAFEVNEEVLNEVKSL